MSWHLRTATVALALVALVAVTYGTSIARNQYVAFDDRLLIVENAAVQEFTPRSVAYAFSSYDPELYIPLTLLSYQIEHALAGGSDPRVTHGVNAALHALNALLVFLLVLALSGRRATAAAVAVLFAVHPLQTEAVAWAAARKDLLSSCFALLSMVLYLRDDDRGGRGYWWSIVAFLCALLAKVTVAPLPALLALAAWSQGQRIDRTLLAKLAPFLFLSAVFIAVAIPGKVSNPSDLGALAWVLLAAKGFAMALGFAVWPTGLAVTHPQLTPIAAASPEFALPVAVALAALAGAAYAWYRDHRSALFWIAFGACFFAPAPFNMVKNGIAFAVSERYAYLALVPVLLGLVVLARRLGLRGRAGMVALAVAVPALAWLSARQAAVWHTSETLFTHVLQRYPSFALAVNNVGAHRAELGDSDGALERYRAATVLDPGYVRAWINIGNALRARGDGAGALEAYAAGVAAIGTTHVVTYDALTVHYVYGQMLLDLGRTDEGLAQFMTAAARDLPHPEAFYNLAVVAHDLSRNDLAEPAIRRAVELARSSIPTRYLAAAILAEQGKIPEAIEHLEYVVRKAPGYENAEEHLRRLRGAR